MQGMMQEMMKGEEGSMMGGGMMGMMKMMGQMGEMMDQCAAMMEQCCSTAETGKTMEGQNK